MDSSLFSNVFEALHGVFMEDKDKAECEALCREYGARAVMEAIDRAKDQNVPRWSYIRAIVTSGGVAKRGGAKGGYIRHDDPPGPVALAAIKEMLEDPTL